MKQKMKSNQGDYFEDECDWCGKVTKVRRYEKDKRYSYCDYCLEEVKECD